MIRFSKTRDVKSPERGTAMSAGIDFFVPDFKGSGYLTIMPHSDVVIPSGIKMDLPKGYMLMAANKSGVATTKTACTRAGLKPKNESFMEPVVLGANIVDADYQGEIYIHLINTGNTIVRIPYGMKIAQFILVPVFCPELEEVSESKLYDCETERGEGAFGSTGTY